MWFSKIIQRLFPYHCCICRNFASTMDLCESCKAELPWVVDRCYRCGLRLEGRDEHILCERCQNNPPHFSRVCALFSYDPPIQRLITGLKFGNQLSNGRVLGELLKEKIQSWYQGLVLPQAILPVPLHFKRLRQRGFNQSYELIRPFLKHSRIPCLYKTVKRSRHTKPQSGLNEEIRRLNVKNAFHVQSIKDYKHLAIVDDVVTTGSTVNALSIALKQQGAEHIDVWCICRA